MRTVAYLTSPAVEGRPVHDGLTVAPLRELGLAVEEVEWRDDEDWDRFAAVLPRSPWDYHLHLEEFFAVLARIDHSRARLFNAFGAMRWNADKSYLGELAARGLAVVPTVFGQRLDAGVLDGLRDRFGGGELVLKPAVGASASDTFRLGPEDPVAAVAHLDGRRWLAQPFVRGIVDEGEYSLVYFDGAFSHALRKRPRPGEYRVQEEFGGTLEPVRPDARLRRRADEVLAALPSDLLYARLDLVREGDDFLLMEAELIEPSLYFGVDPAAAGRFARALAARLGDGA